MAKNNNKTKNKPSVDELINSAVAQQNSWKENRRAFARRFLKTLNIFARPAPKKDTENDTENARYAQKKRGGIMAYWFPILCAIIVILIAVWVMFVQTSYIARAVATDEPAPAIAVPAHTVEMAPSFDIVRIQPDGGLVIAGRWVPDQNVSIVVNKQIIATERTDANGEFAYAPTRVFEPGNYTISLIGVETGIKSQDNVFVYISPNGYENSVSLLMTRDGSTLLQSPTMLTEGDLRVSKIDYLSNGRVVVTGDSMPRLRVSLALNDKYLGWTRVSDHKHFGLGADVGELESGKEYTLTIRLHDGDGNTVSQIGHTFVMPEMTGDDDTYYTVRRGDCLWIIARNFLRRGVLFSIIAERNNIENPDLIFPKQRLQIPVNGK